MKTRIHVGVRINYPPHLGTYLTLASSFLIAKRMNADLQMQALDNAPAEVRGDSFFGLRKPLYAALSIQERKSFIETHYIPLLQKVSELTGVRFRTVLYTESQSLPDFRKEFLLSLACRSTLKWSISAYHALGGMDLVGVRFACRHCGFSRISGETTELTDYSPDRAIFASICQNHGIFESRVETENDTVLDLQKIYRNILKEVILLKSAEFVHIVVKGSDWRAPCSFVTEGLRNLDFSAPPERIFLPVLTTDAGVKLSKSGIQQYPADFDGVPRWVTDVSKYLTDIKKVKQLLVAAESILQSRVAAEAGLSLRRFQEITGFSI